MQLTRAHIVMILIALGVMLFVLTPREPGTSRIPGLTTVQLQQWQTDMADILHSQESESDKSDRLLKSTDEAAENIKQIRSLQAEILAHQRELQESQNKLNERTKHLEEQLAKVSSSPSTQKTYENGRAVVDRALLPDLVARNVPRIEEFLNRKSIFCQGGAPLQWYSQESEDRWYVPQIFGNKTNGLFIEIGGLDGVIFSNTKTLQDTYGWSGLLIEGQVDNAQSMINNRGACTLSLSQAICNKVGTLRFSGPGNAVAGDIDTIRDDIKRVYHERDNYRVIQVDCSPLWAIMRAMKVDHFDLFSLDVEGSELPVLESMDWDIRINLFLVEKQESEEKTQRLHKLMKSKGYRQVRGVAGPNWGYLHQSFKPATNVEYVD